MSNPVTAESGPGPKKHIPFVPENMEMKEFTLRAVLLGLLMTIVLGAANAYLGLRAGITIAATYPAAVIAMAAMRAWKGSLLEENIARTAGSIGESVAAGAIFTLPAFLLAKAWPSFRFADAYWKSTALIMVGSILGVLFISLVRRGMVEDPELPFPESLAASEIHKAGQRGAQAAKYLFWNIGIGGVVYILGKFGLFSADTDLHVGVHRPQAGFDPVCRQCAGLGFDGSFDDVFPWAAAEGLHSDRHSRQLGDHGGRGVEIHRAPDCSRRHAGWRCVHIVQNARESDCRNWQGIRGPAPDGRPASQARTHGTVHEFENGLQFDCCDVRADVFALHQNLGAVVARHSGSGGDDSGGIFLQRWSAFRQPSRASSCRTSRLATS